MDDYVKLQTDKPTYKLEEKVQIQITNTSNQPVNFPDGGYGLELFDKNKKIVWSLDGPEVLTPLEGGKSKTFEWNQQDRNNKQVPEGNYIASVKYYLPQNKNLLTATTEFEIKDHY
jgi:hypothetical protein